MLSGVPIPAQWQPSRYAGWMAGLPEACTAVATSNSVCLKCCWPALCLHCCLAFSHQECCLFRVCMAELTVWLMLQDLL